MPEVSWRPGALALTAHEWTTVAWGAAYGRRKPATGSQTRIAPAARLPHRG